MPGADFNPAKRLSIVANAFEIMPGDADGPRDPFAPACIV